MKCSNVPIQAIAFFVLIKSTITDSLAFQPNNKIKNREAAHVLTSRRDAFRAVMGRGGASAAALVSANAMLLWTVPAAAKAAEVDCYTDCLKNCKAIAPKDTEYCEYTCTDYCSQTDRRDGLSGSVSYEGGEVGILGGTFGSGTVVKGQDKPPSVALPGLDFTTDRGKKLLGY